MEAFVATCKIPTPRTLWSSTGGFMALGLMLSLADLLAWTGWHDYGVKDSVINLYLKIGRSSFYNNNPLT